MWIFSDVGRLPRWLSGNARDKGSISLEKQMTTHPSILAWKILWPEEPGRLQSMGSQRVRYDGVTEHRYHTTT